MAKKINKVVFFVLIFFLFPPKIFANENNQYITIVNPVRISTYTKSVSDNLRSQYKVISDNKLPATWLLTYDVLKNREAINLLKKMNKSQELGIFLEITPMLANASGVIYNETGSWHHATSVFLSGYTQEDREKLIETIFEEFRKNFGYYPKSVGSWWSDGYSLNYMKDKYEITANLTCSDQFLTDGYQLWGQPWEVPFYPNKFYPGAMASNFKTKIDLVNLQWAPRDPKGGYKSSLFSTQDYSVIGLDFNFFKKLVDVYGRKHSNDFGQITIGLESDLSPDVYQGEFKKQIEYAKSLKDLGEFNVTNMLEFGNWYRYKYKSLSPSHLIESDNVEWYQTSRYRVGIEFNDDKVKIFDLRSFSQTLIDPYFVSPNKSFKLSIYLPSIFDEAQSEKSTWEFKAKKDEIEFLKDRIVIKNTHLIKVPKEIAKSKQIKIKKSWNKLEIIFLDNTTEDQKVLMKDFSAESAHFFKRKGMILDLITGNGWNYFKKVEYEIPRGEIESLKKISTLSKGLVMVYDNECLQCSWHSEFKPPAFSNRRSYVKRYSRNSIVYNSSIFEAQDRQKAKEELNKLGVKYIYLVKFESYVEKLPFSPGDLDVVKIYDNANSEVWEVKE